MSDPFEIADDILGLLIANAFRIEGEYFVKSGYGSMEEVEEACKIIRALLPGSIDYELRASKHDRNFLIGLDRVGVPHADHILRTGGLRAAVQKKRKEEEEEDERRNLEIAEKKAAIEYNKESLRIAAEANKLAEIANTLSEKANEKADIANAQSEAAEGRARRANEIAIAAAIIAALATLISIFKN